ncbi:hypothetical protein [Anaeroselena agilis]|uniref:Uncharacterized protein n=1 Tax=Anaeroselena agilis TaxID=3063788 RepID=A0ABU3NV55_9FIRM|nr:hypothetical protein [Selenomonadales bacterium 4137-cl]
MRRPVWDYPEIDDWDDDFARDDRQIVIGAGFGFGFGCYPRRFCFPRQGFFGCFPRRFCFPRQFFFGCYPRRYCYPRRPCYPI